MCHTLSDKRWLTSLVSAAVIVRNLANSCLASFLSCGAHSLFSPFTLIARPVRSICSFRMKRFVLNRCAC